MKVIKRILQLSSLLVLARMAPATEYATMICETGEILSATGDNVYLCKTENCEWKDIQRNLSFPNWSAFQEARMACVKCDGSGRAALCKYDSEGNYGIVEQCANPYEGVGLVVRDKRSRRLLRGLVGEVTKELKVDINGETWVILDPDE